MPEIFVSHRILGRQDTLFVGRGHEVDPTSVNIEFGRIAWMLSWNLSPAARLSDRKSRAPDQTS